MFYKKNQDFRLSSFCDADYAGDRVERKSTGVGCHFLGSSLISWASKKQNSIVLSTTEAEYVSVASCCSQLLWVKYQLEDYSRFEQNILVFCDNTSAINLTKNLIQHSKAKHIEIRYHFIRDYAQKGIFDIKYMDTDHQWADIFTKVLAEETLTLLGKI